MLYGPSRTGLASPPSQCVPPLMPYPTSSSSLGMPLEQHAVCSPVREPSQSFPFAAHRGSRKNKEGNQNTSSLPASDHAVVGDFPGWSLVGWHYFTKASIVVQQAARG